MRNIIFKYSIFLWLCVFVATASSGQHYSKLQTKGEQFLKKEKYDEAITYFSSLDSATRAEDPLYSYYMGVSYYNTPNNKRESIPFFESYLNGADSAQIEFYGHHHVYFFLAKMYHLSYEFEKAEKMYEIFIVKVNNSASLTNEEKVEMIETANQEIAHCKFAKIAIKNPRKVVIENLGDSINTIYPEYASVVSQEEKLLIFTSRRPDTRGGKLAKEGGYYEDIYSVEMNKGSLYEQKNRLEDSTRGLYFNLVTDFEFTNFHRMGDEINGEDHDGSIQLYNDDSVLYFYRDHDIWSIDIKGIDETEAQKMGVHVNSDEYEPSIFFSYDGNKLFIVSDRPGGYGGLDIYVSLKTEGGEWSSPINLGPNINTPYDEDAPYLDPDEQTFYFSSKGNSSMGGYDIFRSTLNDTIGSVPVNIGFPVNTPADDIYFTMTSRYNRAYYASSDLAGVGDMDLYRITFADERDPVAELLGLVRKGDKFVPTKSIITLTSLDGEESISQETDTLIGDYFLLLGHGKTYNMVVETNEFAPYERVFNVPEQKEYFQLYQEIHHVHLYNSEGEIIGQQITVYNALGEADSMTVYYNEETTNNIEKIKEEQNLEGNVGVLSEFKFYITEDSLRTLMREDTTLTFNFDTGTTISFLNSDGLNVFDKDSYHAYEGSLNREEFLKENDVVNEETNKEPPKGTTDVGTINGLFFTVQIGVYSRDIDHSILFNLEPIVTQKTINNLFRYSTGTFVSVETATIRKDEIVEIGVLDAFVTAYYKGERITVDEALALLEEYGDQILIPIVD